MNGRTAHLENTSLSGVTSMVALRKIAVILAGLALSAVLCSPAIAAFKIKFQQSGFADVVVQDNVSPQDLNTNAGAIQLGNGINKFTFGTFEALIITGTSNSPGTVELGQLDIVSVFLRNTGASQATLTVSMTDTDFQSPDPPLILDSLLTGTLQSGTGSVSFQSFADDNNGEFTSSFSTPWVFANLTALSNLPDEFTLRSSNEPFVFSGTYSISNVATYTLSGGAMLNVSSGKTTLVTPEPASIGIWTVALIGLVGLARWRRQQG
jgi:hypothetical protein